MKVNGQVKTPASTPRRYLMVAKKITLIKRANLRKGVNFECGVL